MSADVPSRAWQARVVERGPGRASGARWVALGVGCALAFLLLEGFLRVYNPIPLPMRGRQIVLEAGKRFVMSTPGGKVDPQVQWSHNSLGLRGPPRPRDRDRHVEIVAVGGSTTECRLLSDGKDWPARLAAELAPRLDRVWVGNAGLDGHSSFGHMVLLEQHLADLRPDYVLYLVGINDVDRTQLGGGDLVQAASQASLGERIAERSELLSTALVLYRTAKAYDLGLQNVFYLDLAQAPTATVTPAGVEARLAGLRAGALPDYRARLTRLVERTRALGMEPILITQPALFGEGVDPTTGVELGPRAWDGEPGTVRWPALEAYNDELRAVGAATGTLVIELARGLPKDSALFVDWVHFSNEGGAEVGRRIAEVLGPWLAARHPDHVR